MLALAGTVRLPSPPPAKAEVRVELGGDGDVLLRVIHKVSERLFMERVVRLEDVRAVFAEWSGEPGQTPAQQQGPTLPAGPPGQNPVQQGPPPIQQQAPPPPAGPCDPGEEPPAGATYRTGKRLEDLVYAHLGSACPEGVWVKEAVVYVTEAAAVVLRVEAALTAAESVAYYPPLVGEGTAHAARYLANFNAPLGPDCEDS